MMPSSYAGGASFITNSRFSSSMGHCPNFLFSKEGSISGMLGSGLEICGGTTMGSGILSEVMVVDDMGI